MIWGIGCGAGLGMRWPWLLVNVVGLLLSLDGYGGGGMGHGVSGIMLGAVGRSSSMFVVWVALDHSGEDLAGQGCHVCGCGRQWCLHWPGLVRLMLLRVSVNCQVSDCVLGSRSGGGLMRLRLECVWLGLVVGIIVDALSLCGASSSLDSWTQAWMLAESTSMSMQG